MARVRGRNTRPEMTVRRLVHNLGYRYRLHLADLPGKPDLVFGRRRKVIFVHGCFWHQHPGCRRATKPTTNREFWSDKLQRNVDRDAAQLAALEVQGWQALIIWECEIKKRAELAAKICTYLRCDAEASA